MGWEIGGCVLVAVGLEVVVDDGLGCVFGGIASTMKLFSSTSVSYLFDVATVYVYSFESAITVESRDEGSSWLVSCNCEMSDCSDTPNRN